MELSQGKQSKSGKKREKRRVRIEKKKRKWGEWNSLTVSPSSSPQPIFTVLLFFLLHTIWSVFVYVNVSALRLMGCQSTSGTLW